MQLSVRDVAKLLNVNEKTVYRWVQSGNLPAYRLNNHYRFNRAELLEWATSHKVNFSIDILQEFESQSMPPAGLSEALMAGSIHYRVGGTNKESALAAVVELMRLPEEVDKKFLLQVLLAREAMASTGIGDGIAIPHVRNPIVLHVPGPMATLCFLEKPIDFAALDNKPVNCLFTLVSPTVRAHLYLLSRLAFALRDTGFKDVITRQGTREEILAEVCRVEKDVK
jgi:PTS system nitrogen regulatory IIA component